MLIANAYTYSDWDLLTGVKKLLLGDAGRTDGLSISSDNLFLTSKKKMIKFQKKRKYSYISSNDSQSFKLIKHPTCPITHNYPQAHFWKHNSSHLTSQSLTKWLSNFPLCQNLLSNLRQLIWWQCNGVEPIVKTTVRFDMLVALARSLPKL